MLSSISVVIPTFNRAQLLRETIEKCAQNIADVPVEFIVVDDGSTDETQDVLRMLASKHKNLRWATGQNKGPGYARNKGVEMASHDTILFMGDDIQPRNSDFFRVHSRLHGNFASDRFAVLGKCVWPRDRAQNINFVMAHIQGHGGEQFGFADLPAYAWVDWRFFYTSNISIKKSVVNNWNENGFSRAFQLYGFEDSELAYRLSKEPGGFKIFYDPGAVADHIHQYNSASFLRRQMSAGRMAAVAVTLHHELAKELHVESCLQALASPLCENNEALHPHLLNMIEGLKSFVVYLEETNILGREAWHDDLLAVVFQLAFFQGYISKAAAPTDNLSAAYKTIIGQAQQKLHRIVHHEITAHEYFIKDLLPLGREI